MQHSVQQNGIVSMSLSDQKSSSSSSSSDRPYDYQLVRTDENNPSGRLKAFLEHPDQGVLANGSKKRLRDDDRGFIFLIACI